MPSLIPVCPSPTHPHAHTTYVAERNSNQGKDREKERLAWMSVPLVGCVCVCGDMCVCLWSQPMGEVSLGVWGHMHVEVGVEKSFRNKPVHPPLGVRESVSVRIPNPEISRSTHPSTSSPPLDKQPSHQWLSLMAFRLTDGRRRGLGWKLPEVPGEDSAFSSPYKKY